MSPRRSPLVRQVLDHCRRAGFPLDQAGSILCAVSGGMDSMCLLHLLWEARESLGLTVSAATYDHQLRPQSAEDAAFVRDWCLARGIPCLVGGGEVAQTARDQGLTLEEAGRQMRYAFLEGCRRETGARWIATAHNADDNAETVLLHLLRGTGLTGLGGIPPRRDRILRPLLGCTREEIAAYCAREGIPHREDESNRDTRYTRNFLRHEILPRLRARNPNLTAALCRTAESLRQDEAYLEAQAQAAAQALLRDNGVEVSVSGDKLRKLPQPLALRLVQEMARRVRPDTVLPFGQRQALLALASDKKRGKLSLTNGLQGRLDYDILTLSLPLAEGQSFSPLVVQPGREGTLHELGRQVSCRVVTPSQGWDPEPGTYLLRPPAQGGLLLRPRAVGDRLRLPGRPEKTLKKLFQEAKIPSHQRGLIPVLVLEGQVAGVEGFGVAQDWTPEPGRPAWQITFTQAGTHGKGMVQ